MATERQKEANKLNAQKSTGPKTPEGKAKSCLNRLSHGFASNATVMPGEDPEEFKALLSDLTGEHQPATATEQILVEKMAIQSMVEPPCLPPARRGLPQSDPRRHQIRRPCGPRSPDSLPNLRRPGFSHRSQPAYKDKETKAKFRNWVRSAPVKTGME